VIRGSDAPGDGEMHKKVFYFRDSHFLGMKFVVGSKGEFTACKFFLCIRSVVGGGEHHWSRRVLLVVA
jgi:hypothetical protein